MPQAAVPKHEAKTQEPQATVPKHEAKTEVPQATVPKHEVKQDPVPEHDQAKQEGPDCNQATAGVPSDDQLLQLLKGLDIQKIKWLQSMADSNMSVLSKPELHRPNTVDFDASKGKLQPAPAACSDDLASQSTAATTAQPHAPQATMQDPSQAEAKAPKAPTKQIDPSTETASQAGTEQTEEHEDFSISRLLQPTNRIRISPGPRPRP